MKDVVNQLFGTENKENDENTISESEDEGAPKNSRKKKTKNKRSIAKDKVRDLDWAKVAMLMGNERKSAECLRRFNKISGNRGSEKAGALKGPWTQEEDRKVIALVTANGARKWSQIAAELPGVYLLVLFFCDITKVGRA